MAIMVYRLLVSGRPLKDDLADEIVTLLLPAPALNSRSRRKDS
jgi:hypothetical protein